MINVAMKEPGAIDSADNHALDDVENERVVVVAHDADSGVVALDGVDGQVVEIGEREWDEEVRCTPE